MATVIRMRRGGRTHKPYYRIVVQDSRTRDRGPEIDTIGYYHPIGRPQPISEVNVHKALDWLRKGAQLSDTARSVFSKTGVLRHFQEGTTPEEPIAVLKGAKVEQKGYNAPPAPKPAPEKEAAPETSESGPQDEAETTDEASGGGDTEATTDAESPPTDGEQDAG